MKTPTNRLAELDALRGIAALLVVFFHYTIHRPEAEYGFKLGITGVDLFFIISGFVITMSISRISRGVDFVISRASRLYPAYWAAVLLTFFLVVAKSIATKHGLADASSTGLLANLTMFQYYFGVRDLDGSYWSLIVEMVFYLFVLVLLHWNRLKQINAIGGSFVFLAVCLQFTWNENTKEFFHYAVLFKYLPLFLAGINFYKLYTGQGKRLQHYAIIGYCFAAQLLLFRNCSRAFEYLSFSEYAVALAVLFGTFVLFVNGRLRFIVNRTTIFFGKISYPLYLTHQFLALQIFFPPLLKNSHLNFWIASFGIVLPLNILVAYFIAKYVDEPYSKKLKERLQRLQAPKFSFPGFTWKPTPQQRTKTVENF